MSAPFAAVFKGTEKGSRTDVMGDRVIDQVFENEARLIGVVDARGDSFRSMVAKELEKVILKRLHKWSQTGSSGPAAALMDALTTADKALRDAVETKQPRKAKIAGISGAFGLLVRDDVAQSLHLFTARFGDCRIYHFRDEQFLSRTEDQTEGTEKVRAHLLSADDLAKNPGQYRPVNLLCAPTTVTVEIGEPAVLAVDDRILFCTDGVHDAVDEEQLRNLALGADVEKVPDHINQYAEINGNDDKACLLMGIRDRPARIAGPGGAEDADPAVRMPDDVNIPLSALDQLDSVIDLSPIDRGDRAPDEQGPGAKHGGHGDWASSDEGPSRRTFGGGVFARVGRRELIILIAIVVLGGIALTLFLIDDNEPTKKQWTPPERKAKGDAVDPAGDPLDDDSETDPSDEASTDAPKDPEPKSPFGVFGGTKEPADVKDPGKTPDDANGGTVMKECSLTDMRPKCVCPRIGADGNQCAEFISCQKTHQEAQQELTGLTNWSESCEAPVSEVKTACIQARDLQGFGPAINLYNDTREKYRAKCSDLEDEHRARVKRRNREECEAKLASVVPSNLSSMTSCKSARIVLNDSKSPCKGGGLLDSWASKTTEVDSSCTKLEKEIACNKALSDAEVAVQALEGLVQGKSTREMAVHLDRCAPGHSYKKSIDAAVSKCQDFSEVGRARAAHGTHASLCNQVRAAKNKIDTAERERKRKRTECQNQMNSALGLDACSSGKNKINAVENTCKDAGLQKDWIKTKARIKSNCSAQKNTERPDM